MSAFLPGGHPGAEDLRHYALALLGPAEAQQVEAHLPGCAACRASVAAWQTDLTRAVEALPAPGPLPELRPMLPASPPAGPARPPLWSGRMQAAAAVLVLAVVSLAALGWTLHPSAVQGNTVQEQGNTMQGERRLVSAWLARSDVRLVALSDLKRRPAGRVLVSADGQALFVLPDAPPGLEYRAWVARDWHRGEPMALAQRSRSGTFAVVLGQNDYLCLSLEKPDAAHTGPTHILGKAFL